MRHAAASQSPVFACSPGNCTSYTSHFGRRTSNKKMMMSWYPKQPDITSFKWMFLDFQPFPFLKIWNNLELSNRNNHFFQCSALGFHVPNSLHSNRPDLWGTNYVLAGFVALGAINPSAEWTTLDQARIFPSPASLLPQFRRFGHKKNQPKMSTISRRGIWTKTIYDTYSYNLDSYKWID